MLEDRGGRLVSHDRPVDRAGSGSAEGAVRGWLRSVWWLAAVGAVVAVACGVGYGRLRLLVVTVEGRSMEPTLYAGDRLLVRRGGLGSLRRGDLVVLHPPDVRAHVAEAGHWQEPTGGTHVKRVEALPGHPMPSGVGDPSSVVPAGTVVVLSDNAELGLDSRQWGPYPAGGLVGVVVRRMTAKPAGGGKER